MTDEPTTTAAAVSITGRKRTAPASITASSKALSLLPLAREHVKESHRFPRAPSLTAEEVAVRILIGTVEDIGMRSTRVRTLNRTLVSVPNSTFAGANLGNYSQRDKILFNPTFQIKRGTPDEQVWHLIDSIHEALKKNRSVELVPTPVRLTALTAAGFSIEVFCYVLTPDINEFYRIQGELLLAINDALQAAQLELV